LPRSSRPAAERKKAGRLATDPVCVPLFPQRPKMERHQDTAGDNAMPTGCQRHDLPGETPTADTAAMGRIITPPRREVRKNILLSEISGMQVAQGIGCERGGYHQHNGAPGGEVRRDGLSGIMELSLDLLLNRGLYWREDLCPPSCRLHLRRICRPARPCSVPAALTDRHLRSGGVLRVHEERRSPRTLTSMSSTSTA
jgi:hypothetical protein